MLTFILKSNVADFNADHDWLKTENIFFIKGIWYMECTFRIIFLDS